MIYDKIKEICKSKGISVTSLEKKANLSNGSISKWNVSIPTVYNLKSAADALNVKIDDLLD